MKKNKLLKIFIALIILINIEGTVIATTTGVVNVETVRVREKATTDSDIVELVSIGDKINILGEEGNWYQVKVGKVTGYIRKDLLTVDKNATIPTSNNVSDEEPEENNSAEEPKESNNSDVREEEKTTNSEETPNVVTPIENVERNDKTISTLKTIANVSVGKTIKLSENIKIKILPVANSSNILELQANTEVTVLEIINSWCRIETAEGECGWVRIDQ